MAAHTLVHRSTGSLAEWCIPRDPFLKKPGTAECAAGAMQKVTTRGMKLLCLWLPALPQKQQ